MSEVNSFRKIVPLKQDETLLLTALPQSTPPPKEGFESYYLKQITAEFADDIDKLRNAPDFSAQSVPILIQALKKGSKGFTGEEKEKLMRGM